MAGEGRNGGGPGKANGIKSPGGRAALGTAGGSSSLPVYAGWLSRVRGPVVRGAAVRSLVINQDQKRAHGASGRGNREARESERRWRGPVVTLRRCGASESCRPFFFRAGPVGTTGPAKGRILGVLGASGP